MKSLNCCVAPYDLFMSSSSNMNKPCLVFTLDKTVYTQFDHVPHLVMMSCFIVLPWSL